MGALDTLARNTQGRILLTSRIVGYQEPPFPLRGDDSERGLELVAFDREQVEGFIGSWFEDAPERSGRLRATLRREPALRTLARIPLLLSFICLVSAGDDPIPTRRAALYETVLRRLLEGRWRPEELREQVRGRIGHKLRLLETVAWHFAISGDRWRDLLPEEELDEVILAAPRAGYLQRTARHDNSLLWELSELDGVLVKAGEAPPDMTETQVPYLFLHRTIHEYLVASHLARQATDEWLAQVHPHFWFDPDWEEAIVLLAGRLADPQPLLEALLAEPHDAFHAMLLLAGRCLAEAGPDSVNRDLVTPITERLLAMLWSASARDRYRAARVLVRLRNLAVERLLAALQDPEWEMRLVAVRALGRIGESRAVEGLLAALRDPHRSVHLSAVEALGWIGDPEAVPDLLAILRDPDESMRRAAGEVLGQIGDPQAVPDLLAMLRDSSDSVRETAAAALGQIGNPQAVPELLAVLRDPNWRVRRVAAEALGQIGDPRAVPELLAALRDLTYQVRRVAAEALGQIGDSQVVPDLLQALQDPNGWVREAAAEALGQIGDPQTTPDLLQAALHDPELPNLLQALRDPDRDERAMAAELLGEIGDPQAVPGLLAALRDPDDWVRVVAADALGQIGDPQAVPSLLATLHDPDEMVREAAASALYWIGDSQALDGLLAVLCNPHESVRLRTEAASALGRIGNSQAVPDLLATLRDSLPSVRWSAAYALGQIGDPQTVPGLVAALRDPDDLVRRVAAEVLGRIGDLQALPHLLQALWDPHHLMREEAAEALGRIGAPKAVPDLLAALRDPHDSVRHTAAEALGKIGDPKAVPDLLAALCDPHDQRGAAGVALKKLVRGQDAIITSDHLVHGWPDPAVDDRDRVFVYELLMQLSPRLCEAVRDAWPAWRARLMSPTAYALALGLARRPARARQAEQLYRSVLKQFPSFPPALKNLGRLLLSWPGRAAEAEALFQQCLEGQPEDPEAWNELGKVLSQLERHQPALDAFRRAADLTQVEDTRAMCLCNCAGACLDLRWLDQVEAFLAQAAALDADHPYLHLRHAQLHLARGELDAAIDRCRQALVKSRHLAEVHFTLGLALLCAGRRKAAEEAYNSGLELAREWVELEDACQALEKQMQARGDLAGVGEILSRLRAARDELVAQWPAA